MFLHLIAVRQLTGRCRDQALGAVLRTVVSFEVKGEVATAKLARMIADRQPKIPYVAAASVVDIRVTTSPKSFKDGRFSCPARQSGCESYLHRTRLVD